LASLGAPSGFGEAETRRAARSAAL